MNNKKIILITGGMWYIWSHAVIAFEEAWYKTVILDNLSNSCLSTYRMIWKILWYKPDFFEVDLRDKSKLEEIFLKYNFDWVIHFAWLKAVWESCEKPALYYDNNLVWSILLFELMEKYNVKNIIFSSSATVYNYDNKIPYIEWQPVWKTTNPYWTIKYLIEKVLYDFSIFSNFNVINLRYFNPIWAHPSWYLWENTFWIPNNLLPFILKVANKDLDCLNVFWWDYDTVDWTWVRDYIDVCDLVDWHIKAYDRILKMSKNNNKGFSDVYNLWIWKWVSVLELLCEAEKVIWNKIPYKIIERREWDIAEFYCDSSKAKNELSWEANTSLNTSLKNSWKFYNK